MIGSFICLIKSSKCAEKVVLKPLLPFLNKKEEIAAEEVSILRTTEVIFCSEDSQTTTRSGPKKLEDLQRKYTTQ